MRPRARLLDAGDGADQRTLARAVGADDGHDLALGDLERHAGQRLGVAVEEVEVLDLEKGAHHAGSAFAQIDVEHGLDGGRSPAGAPSAMISP
jgi:hypothetical protein